MKPKGQVSVGSETFDYELHDLGDGNAKHLVNPSTNQNKDRYHKKVTLKKSNGFEKAVFMHPIGRQSDNLDEFVAGYVSHALAQFQFEQIPSRFDRPTDTETERCPWC